MIYKFLVFLFLFLSPLFFVSAKKNDFNFKIFVDSSFADNESVDFWYVGESDFEDLKYIPRIECDGDIPVKFPEELSLKEESGVKMKYSGFIVSDNISSQSCRAIIDVISPTNFEYSENFSINTRPVISPNLLYCRDLDCSKYYSTINNSDEVFLSVSSKINTDFKLKIRNEDNDLDIISIPTWHIFKDGGIYNLEIISPNKAFKVVDSSFVLKVEKKYQNKNETLKHDWLNLKGALVVLFFVFIFLTAIVIFLRKRMNNN